MLSHSCIEPNREKYRKIRKIQCKNLERLGPKLLFVLISKFFHQRSLSFHAEQWCAKFQLTISGQGLKHPEKNTSNSS